MFRRFFSAIFGLGIGLAVAIAQVHAADEIETKAQPCAACHGDKGVPTDPKTIPVIWGQERSYLMKQLRDFRNGERESAVMSAIAKGLAEDDLRKIAVYFSAKTWPARAAPAKQPLPPKGIAQCQAVISRTSRVACRPRGWPGSAMNISSRQCAPLPPSSEPTTSTCRSSCRR